MSLIHSVPQQKTPWRDLLTAAFAALVLPALLGAVMLGVFYLIGAKLPGDSGLLLWAGGMMLLLSPMLAAAGMVLAVPVASLLLRLGWFGWAPAAVTGLSIGAVMAGMLSYELAAPFGMGSLLILRAVLGRLRPMAV
ncbi:hypothetical protein [Pseudotabrizicola sp. L79]|uniref:hypothetical protein n=1 Tax=Pseudotabrizicola sp. L79 TaxID=3118402 RepID=UPI002F92EFDF